jgi:hypothetical protein
MTMYLATLFALSQFPRKLNLNLPQLPLDRNLTPLGLDDTQIPIEHDACQSPLAAPSKFRSALWSPLHLALANGHTDVAQLPLHHGARVDVVNDRQQTLLDRAAAEGKVEVVVSSALSLSPSS